MKCVLRTSSSSSPRFFFGAFLVFKLESYSVFSAIQYAKNNKLPVSRERHTLNKQFITFLKLFKDFVSKNFLSGGFACFASLHGTAHCVLR
jgi:hypothetical protein